MRKLYLIPGLGADCRIYQRLDLTGYEVVFVDWVIPEQHDTLGTYAQKLIKRYKMEPNAVLLGNSMGGMVAVEIANRMPMQQVIIISSIKTADEASPYFKFFRNFPLQKILPPGVFVKFEGMLKYAFGPLPEADLNLLKDMLRKTPPVFIKWAMGAIVRWQNQTIPPNVVHINGNKDRLFDYHRAKNAIIVDGGTHLMVFDRADEMNALLRKYLKS